MTQEDYRRAGGLFDQIRGLGEEERAAALRAACGGDVELQGQVTRLLAADSQAHNGGFLEGRAIEDAARILIPPQQISSHQDLPPEGAVVGTYRLGAKINAGGMGVIYEAEDLRLLRRVAVKVLPLPFGGAEKERIQRFEREARAASYLNHPNIVSIFDANYDNGFYYIAMELVEGRTLRSLIADKQQPLDAKMILELVSQVASALSAAHQSGIIHRDIKPENIMVRPDGFVKVLDFGLASSMNGAAMMSSDLRTRPGQLAGTIQYLSPEQVMGQAAEPRSDLFSLGVVAYELAAGVRPFEGASDGAIFNAILHHMPTPPSKARASLGIHLDDLILRAIEKDPNARFQTAAELLNQAKRLNLGVSGEADLRAFLRVKLKRALKIAVPALAALTTVAAASVLIWYFTARPTPNGFLLPYRFQQMTDSTSEETSPSLAPDGKQFVYASPRDGNWDIYLQRTGGSTLIDLTGDCSDDDIQPALSPDGSRIAFRSERQGGGLFVMESTGENPRRISERGYLPAWSPDGRQIVYSTHTFSGPSEVPQPPSNLYVVNTDDGGQRKLGDFDARQPSWSPHGSRIAYWSLSAGGRRDIFTLPADGSGPPRAVTEDAPTDWNPVWSPSGQQLYFLSDRGGTMNVWRVPIDEKSGSTLGPPEPVTVPAQYVSSLTIGGDGKSLVYSQSAQRRAFGRIRFNSTERTTEGAVELVDTGHPVGSFSFSPDGSKIVYDTLADSSENLWIMNADGGGRRRLTSGSFHNRGPVWSPKGDEILFYSDRAGHYDNWLIGVDGGGLRPLTNGLKPEMQDAIWSPDGRRILAGRFAASVELNPSGAQRPHDVSGLENEPGVFCGDWTDGPDGSQAVCMQLMGPRKPEIVIFHSDLGKLEHTGVTGREPSWVPTEKGEKSEEHRFFVFFRNSDFLLYDRTLRRETRIFSVMPNRIYGGRVSPDGKHLYFSERIRDAHLWLARLGRP